MIRAFQILDVELYRDFENYVFSIPETHSMSFDFPNDTVTIDSVDYRISTLCNTAFSCKTESNTAQTISNTTYKISRTDDDSAIEYYGYVSAEGTWYIMKIDTTNKIYTYVNGNTDFLTSWGDRTNLTYDEYNNLTW